jgi:hypothetical protein
MDHPMTCSDISCGDGMACRLRIRPEGFPPVVRCLPVDRIQDCVTGTCNEGLMCIDDGPSVRCESPLITCEKMDCPVGYECMLDDTNKPTCSLAPPPSTSTCQPECQQGDQCTQFNVDGEITSTCFPKACLDCESLGLACVLSSNNPIAECRPVTDVY